MCKHIEEWCESGLVNIVGGCCGTDPHHIAHFVEASEKNIPRKFGQKQYRELSEFSGLENFTIRPDSNFTMIGERTNVTGSRKFARLIKEEKYEEALEVALHQIEGGANIIDVNMDEGLLNSEKCMSRFLNLIELRRKAFFALRFVFVALRFVFVALRFVFVALRFTARFLAIL